jgi:hypothetical protein
MSYFDVDYDPVTKIKTVFEAEADDSQYTIASLQDATDIVEQNKYLYNEFDQRARHTSEMYNRYAQIPLNLFFELERKGITRDPVAFKKWMDDPDNRFFRTRPGKLSR